MREAGWEAALVNLARNEEAWAPTLHITRSPALKVNLLSRGAPDLLYRRARNLLYVPP